MLTPMNNKTLPQQPKPKYRLKMQGNVTQQLFFKNKVPLSIPNSEQDIRSQLQQRAASGNFRVKQEHTMPGSVGSTSPLEWSFMTPINAGATDDLKIESAESKTEQMNFQVAPLGTPVYNPRLNDMSIVKHFSPLPGKKVDGYINPETHLAHMRAQRSKMNKTPFVDRRNELKVARQEKELFMGVDLSSKSKALIEKSYFSRKAFSISSNPNSKTSVDKKPSQPPKFTISE